MFIWKFVKRHAYLFIFLTALATAGVVWYANQETPEAQASHCGFPHFNCGIPCPFGVCFTPPPPPISGAPGTCSLAINANPDAISAGQSSSISITPSPAGTLSGGTFSASGNSASYTFSSSGITATLTAVPNASATGVNVTASGWTLTSSGVTSSCSSVITRVNIGGITTCQLNSSGPSQMYINEVVSISITANEPIAVGTLTSSVNGAGTGSIISQNASGGTIRVTAGSIPGTVNVTANASSSTSSGACRSAQHQISVQAIVAPPPPPGCPSGNVLLGTSILNPGQTTTAYAPNGWTLGSFFSTTTAVASTGSTLGNAATVYANGAGTASIYGTGWRASNGATNCYLNGNFLTVTGSAPSVALVASTPVLYGDVSNLSWTAVNVNSGTPCTASSVPAGSWSGSFAAIGTDQSNALTVDTTFTITCTHPTGSVSDSETVTVALPPLACNPAAQTVGQNAVAGVAASGGIGPFTWSAPGGSPASGSGNSFSTTYAATGAKTITVTDSVSQTANCSVTVNSGAVAATVTLSATNPVSYDTPTTLVWFSSNTSSCSATAGVGFDTANATNGTDQSSNLTTSPTVFTIVCTDSGGGPPVSDSESVTVLSSPAPTGWISGSDCSVVSPGTSCPTTITWGTNNVANSAQVRLSINGASETLFDCATNAGSSPAGFKDTTLNVGSTYVFRLYAAPSCVDGATSGSSGDVILLWDGAASAPGGWTCVSCNAGDAFYNLFPRASDVAGGTGGSDVHSNTLSYSSATSGASVLVGEGGFGGFYPKNDHTHTWPDATSTIGSTLPEYKHLKLIQKNAPSTIPAGSIGIFDAALPSGWVDYTDVDNKYLRTAGDTATGGSATHAHTFSSTSTSSLVNLNKTDSNTSSVMVHTHAISGSLSSGAVQPPYVTVKFGKLFSDAVFLPGIIGLFDGAVPSEWTTQSTSASVYYQRFLYGSSAFGATAGSGTHSHGGSVTVTSGTPSTGAQLFKSGFSGIGSTTTHTHDVTYTVGSGSSLPAYRDVVLGKYVGYTVLASVSPQATVTANAADLTPSNKDIIAVRGNTAPGSDPGTLAGSRNDANISAVAPINAGDSVTFAINLVNTVGNSAETDPITIEDTMYNLAPLDDGTVQATVACGGKCTMPAPTLTYDSLLSVLRLSFTVTPTVAGGGLVSPDIWTVTYTAKTKAPPGSSASAFRFLNEAALNGGLATDWLTTPAILFYREINVPSIQER